VELIGLLTPAAVHYGQAAALLEKRQRVREPSILLESKFFTEVSQSY
jgi:hypothetical protein